MQDFIRPSWQLRYASPAVFDPLESKHPKPVHDPLDLLLIEMAAIPVPDAAAARTVSTIGRRLRLCRLPEASPGQAPGAAC